MCQKRIISHAEISSDLVKDKELRIEFVNQKEYLNFQLLMTKRGLWFFN